MSGDLLAERARFESLYEDVPGTGGRVRWRELQPEEITYGPPEFVELVDRPREGMVVMSPQFADWRENTPIPRDGKIPDVLTLVGGPLDGDVAVVWPANGEVIISGFWYGRSVSGNPELIYHTKADAVDMKDPTCIKLIRRETVAHAPS